MIKKKRLMPHHLVYTRVTPSVTHGVGVIAVRPIKKRALIFSGGYGSSRWVPVKEVSGLPRRIRELYRDFCLRINGWYGCPKSFNALTPAYFVNHSTTPNVGCNNSHEFYALRKIKAGEELLVDYRSYSKLYSEQPQFQFNLKGRESKMIKQNTVPAKRPPRPIGPGGRGGQ